MQTNTDIEWLNKTIEFLQKQSRQLQAENTRLRYEIETKDKKITQKSSEISMYVIQIAELYEDIRHLQIENYEPIDTHIDDIEEQELDYQDPRYYERTVEDLYYD